MHADMERLPYVEIVHQQQQQPFQYVSHGEEVLIAIPYIPARHF